MQQKIINDQNNELKKFIDLYFNLLEDIPDIIFFKDIKGIFAGCNKAFTLYAGYPHSEIIGKTDYDIFPKHLADYHRKKDLLTLQSGISKYYEEQITYPDGTEVTVKILKTPIFDKNKQLIGLLGTYRNITEYVKSEEIARINEERFRDLALCSSDWIWEINNTGKYTYCSEDAERILGYTVEEVIGKTPFDFMPESEVKRLSNYVGNIIANGKPIKDLENINITKDGKEITLLTNGVPIYDKKGEICGYRGVDKDITRQKQVEAKLRNAKELIEASSKSHLKAILDNMPFMAWLKDANGHFISVNRLFAEACEHNIDDIIGKTDYDVWPKELAEGYRADDKDVMNSGKQKTVEEYIDTPDGRKWFETFKTPIFDISGNIIGTTGFARDITARKIQEEEILTKDRLLSAVSEAINELTQNFNFDKAIVNAFGIIGKAIKVDRVVLFKNSFDEKSKKIVSSYRYEWVSDEKYAQINNPLLQNIPISSIPEILGSLFLENPLIAKADELEPVMKDLLNNCDVCSIMLFPIFIRGYFWGYVGFDDCKKQREWSESEKAILMSFAASISSVIQKKEKHEEIQESLQLIREKDALQSLIMESTENGYIMFDKENNIILINNTFIEMFDLPEKVRTIESAKEIINLLSEKMKESQFFIENTLKVFQTLDKAKESYELKNNRIIETYTLPLFKDDEKIGRLFNFRDITKLKEVEKMKNEFISTVSHELRTPLTSIRGSLGLILGDDENKIPEDVKALLNIAHTNCMRLISLINDILDIEKIEAGKMEFFFEILDLKAVIEQAIVVNLPFAQQYNVDLILNNCPENIKVKADKNRLNQVLTNLMSNAVKYSSAGDSVEINVELSNDFVKISVKDFGSGIPEAFRSKIFGKFAQADSSDSRRKGGTGLGLSICKAIVEKMGGSIGFNSVVNKETTFYFFLPQYNGN